MLVYQGFPARMVYFFYISCLRYTILVGNPRYCVYSSSVHACNALSWCCVHFLSIKSLKILAHRLHKDYNHSQIFVHASFVHNSEYLHTLTIERFLPAIWHSNKPKYDSLCSSIAPLNFMQKEAAIVSPSEDQNNLFNHTNGGSFHGNLGETSERPTKQIRFFLVVQRCNAIHSWA